MTSVTIELRKNGNNIEYSVDSSGDQQLDQLAQIAVQAAGMYAKSGGNMQSLLGSIGGPLKQQISSMLMGGGMPGMMPGMMPGNMGM